MVHNSNNLTNKQAELCRFVERFWNEHGFAPTLQEIADGLHLAGRSAAQQRVQLTARKGYLIVEPRSPRSIRLTDSWTQWKNHRLNRRTNPAVDRVFATHPEEFRDWTEAQWRQLRSVRGTGGALTEAGVLNEVNRINEAESAKQLFSQLLEVEALRDELISWIKEKADTVSPRNRKTVNKQDA